MEIRLLVGIPSHSEHWHYQFCLSLSMMMLECEQRKFYKADSQGVTLHITRGSMLPYVRQCIVDFALERDFTHTLFIDNDQTFPRDTAHRLLATGRDVVACNIATKLIPADTNTRLYDGSLGGVKFYTDPQSVGTKEVWRTGMGIMLVNNKVFKKIPRPHFEMYWGGKDRGFVGEDWNFCEKLEAHGIKPYINQTLSKHIGHVGTYEYKHDIVGEIVKTNKAGPDEIIAHTVEAMRKERDAA